jgi:hypothetical protein
VKKYKNMKQLSKAQKNHTQKEKGVYPSARRKLDCKDVYNDSYVGKIMEKGKRKSGQLAMVIFQKDNHLFCIGFYTRQ